MRKLDGVGLRALEEALRGDRMAFFERCFHELNPASQYCPGWHAEAIGEALGRIERGQARRLIVNMPPRYLKSLLVTVGWPAWLLGGDPSRRILCASYSRGLSVKHALDSRHVMASPWYRRIWPETVAMEGQNEKHKLVTTRHGFRFATSVGGTLTGEGGDILIMDDPINPLQAESRLKRELANRWFEHSFASRLNDKRKGAIVLVMQRLHENDLSGFLLEKGGWEHLCLPAIAARAQVFDLGWRLHAWAAGEALHPPREDAEMLARVKAEMGSRAFAAQYLQAPQAAEGKLIRREWLRRYAHPPEMEYTIQSWDTAIKGGGENDASACATIGIAGDTAYLLHMAVLRLPYPQLRQQMAAMAAAEHPQAVLIEDKASGQTLLQELRGSIAAPLIAVQPRGDKVTRCASVSALIEAGRVLLPAGAPWLAAFEEELLGFPGGRHDDQVDAFTQALQWWQRRSQAQPVMRRL